MHTLTARKATLSDLPAIVNLLIEDELGQTREKVGNVIDQRYINAFQHIDSDSNQYLMVVENEEQQIIATCHLTIMPSLTFIGSTRMQIEAVRVSSHYRGQKIGEWMMNAVFEWAKTNDVSIIQLTTNKQRLRAKQFYERPGFTATHEGMKFIIG
jgi:ribosomal protein S18 acetylase RimI-like enzyme